MEQAAKDLDLVFGDQLGEGDEEADLEGRQAVVRHAVAACGKGEGGQFRFGEFLQVRATETGGAQEEGLVAQDGRFDNVDGDGDDVRDDDDCDDKLDEFGGAPDSFEVPRCERERQGRDEELRGRVRFRRVSSLYSNAGQRASAPR